MIESKEHSILVFPSSSRNFFFSFVFLIFRGMWSLFPLPTDTKFLFCRGFLFLILSYSASLVDHANFRTTRREQDNSTLLSSSKRFGNAGLLFPTSSFFSQHRFFFLILFICCFFFFYLIFPTVVLLFPLILSFHQKIDNVDSCSNKIIDFLISDIFHAFYILF